MRDQPNRILEFLTTPARPDGEASRTNRRRRSSAIVQLTWADGAEWRTIRGRLRDISRAGAALIAPIAPPMTARARLRLVDGEGTPWVEAEILGVEEVSPKRHRIRIRFTDPCPSFMLRLAILGVVEPGEEAQVAPTGWVAWAPRGAEWVDTEA